MSSTLRVGVTQDQAVELAAHLGDAVRMDLGEHAIGWWVVRRLECQPGTGWLHVVLEEAQQ